MKLLLTMATVMMINMHAIPPIPEPPEPPAPEPYEILGEYTVTAYCPCEICCGDYSDPARPRTASGTIATEGRTCGADWDTLGEGTIIEIEGVGERTVEDSGADWVGDRYSNKYIDVYFDTHDEAVEFGKRVCTIKIKK